MANKFDYYADPHSLLSRSLLVMLSEARIAGRDAEENFYEEVKERSKDFSEVELSIKLNGLEVDANTFMTRFDAALDAEVKYKVNEKLQAIDEITEIEDELEHIRDILKQRINQLADKYNIELYRED
jgi:hypothetical protein